MFRTLAIVMLFGLVACGGTSEAPVTAARNDVAVEAVADVDAAMSEASPAGRAPAPVPAN